MSKGQNLPQDKEEGHWKGNGQRRKESIQGEEDWLRGLLRGSKDILRHMCEANQAFIDKTQMGSVVCNVLSQIRSGSKGVQELPED